VPAAVIRTFESLLKSRLAPAADRAQTPYRLTVVCGLAETLADAVTDVALTVALRDTRLKVGAAASADVD
jgi:hypothetical protein